MNRIIKFRVWDNLGKGFVHNPFIVGHPLFMLNIKFELGYIKDAWDGQPDPSYTFQQFIGLLDSKGKEIYEGDILEYFIPSNYMNGGKYIGIIEWEHAKFKAKEPSNFGEILMGDKIKLYPSIDDGRIIGNIFENSESLK